MYKDINDEIVDPFNVYNDPNKFIQRVRITTENRVAFPYMYNNKPRGFVSAPYFVSKKKAFKNKKESAFDFNEEFFPLPEYKREKSKV